MLRDGIYGWSGDDEGVLIVPGEFIRASQMDDSNEFRLAIYKALTDGFKAADIQTLLVEEEPLPANTVGFYDPSIKGYRYEQREPSLESMAEAMKEQDDDNDSEQDDTEPMKCLHCGSDNIRILYGETVECQACWKREPLTSYNTDAQA